MSEQYHYGYDNVVLSEIQRNASAYALFERMLKRAFGQETKVVINHHIVYEVMVDGRRNTQEIPSADTFIFSPYYMSLVFGQTAEPVMRALLMCSPQQREDHLNREMDMMDATEQIRKQQERSRTPLALRAPMAMTISAHPLDGVNDRE